MCPSGTLLSFLNVLYIHIILFINLIFCLVELCRTPFEFSDTLAFTVVLSMKCFAEEGRAVCFTCGGCNRHLTFFHYDFSLMLFFFVFFFLIAEISCSMVHQGLERH